MKPRPALALALALALVLEAPLPAADAAKDFRLSRGNLILISLDTCRADHMSLYGYPRPTTPALERLAKDAVVFETAVSGAYSTAPSHMTLLTGWPASVHGVIGTNLDGPAADYVMLTQTASAEKFATLAERLRQRGYSTAAFTGGAGVSREAGLDRGFELFLEPPDSGVGGYSLAPIDVSKALGWLRTARERDRPYFLFLHTYLLHAPYIPPEPYASRFDPGYEGPILRREDFVRANTRGAEIARQFWRAVDLKNPGEAAIRRLEALYDGEIAQMDDILAGLFEEFDRMGLREDTVIVLTSDHGEQFFEHGDFEHRAPVPWEQLIRVPLLVFFPRTAGRGFRVAGVAGAVDVLPTLLDALGLPADAGLPGRSLLGDLPARRLAAGKPAVTEMIRKAAVSADGRAWEPVESFRSVRDERYKLVTYSGIDREDLFFDLWEDPREERSRLTDPSLRAEVSRLRAAAAELDRLGRTNRAAGRVARPSPDLSRQLKALGYMR